jgi:Tol biopolymer transport system component
VIQKISVVLAWWLSLGTLCAQNGTEVYLLDLSVSAGQLALSNPRNVSDKPGYDNQPFFHPTQPLLYYTSMMADKQTDIWSYNTKTGVRKQLTSTPDSEYSPTVLPDKQAISCIVQRKANGDQDLVKYSLSDPTATTLLLESQKTGKIGYQAWLNQNEAVVFVLGEPNSMHFLNRKTGKDTIIATTIGRSLHRVPGQKAFSFVQQVGDKWLIRAYNPARNQISTLAESSPDSEHYMTWVTTGILLESRGNELWQYDLKTTKWQAVRLPENLPHRKLSRIAVQGKQIALVVEE